MAKAKRSKPGRSARRVRGTVLSSGFTGVLAMIAGAVWLTPGGVDGLVGTSVAHDLPSHQRDPGDYGFPHGAPALTEGELRGIESELDQSIASMDAVRASTDAEIERMKALSDHAAVMPVTGAPRYDDLATLLLAGRG